MRFLPCCRRQSAHFRTIWVGLGRLGDRSTSGQTLSPPLIQESRLKNFSRLHQSFRGPIFYQFPQITAAARVWYREVTQVKEIKSRISHPWPVYIHFNIYIYIYMYNVYPYIHIIYIYIFSTYIYILYIYYIYIYYHELKIIYHKSQNIELYFIYYEGYTICYMLYIKNYISYIQKYYISHIMKQF